MATENVWGILYRDGEEYLALVDDNYLFGRNSKVCHTKLVTPNPRISTSHCRFSNHEGVPTLFDLSTNGTFHNGSKLGKGNNVKLKTGDIISMPFSHVKKEDNNIFTFQLPPEPSSDEETQELRPEESATVAIPAFSFTTSKSEDSLQGYESESPEPPTTPENPSSVQNEESESESSPDQATVDKPMQDQPEDSKKDLETKPDTNVGEKRQRETQNDPPAVLPPSKKPKLDQDLEENFTCRVCTDIYYKPISLSPCFHNFCACCFSEWRTRSNTCPTCRAKVSNIGKNHTLANLVEAYISAHPEKQRAEEETKEMDEKCNITEQELAGNSPKRFKSRGFSDTDEEEEEEEEDDEEEENDFYHTSAAGYSGFAAPYNTGLYQPAGFTGIGCLRCNTPGHDGFQCIPGVTSHIICSCCSRTFPQRPEKRFSCELCKQKFCDDTIGCATMTGQGALKQFSEFQVMDIPSSNQFNPHEVKILKDYLQAKNISLQEMYEECLEHLENGTYKLENSNITTEWDICKRCVGPLISSLALQYRTNIPNDDLPDSVTSRNNCYWGKACRTQTHNTKHMTNFNHICPQTRF